MDSNLSELINLFSKLPSIGHRSATRIVIGLIRNKMLMGQLGNQLTHAATQLNHCKNCGNITSDDICSICSNENRRNGTLCIVEEIEDLWAIEKSGCFNGLYHVLGGTLSALKGITPDELRIKNLNQRLKDENITEIIMATNQTSEGKTTAFYLIDIIENKDIKITQPAQGVPLGSELDYIDEATLKTAFNARFNF